MNKNSVKEALKRAEPYLLSLKGEDLWGESSSSPYSTAWALLAFLYSDSESTLNRARPAAEWLLSHQNSDGSWGSALRYHEKLIFTPYCLAALLLYEKNRGKLPRLGRAVRNAQKFIRFSTNVLQTLDSVVEMAYSRMHPALWIAEQNDIPYLNRFDRFRVCNFPQDVIPESSGICDEMISLNFVLPHLVESHDTELLKQLEKRQLPNGSWFCCVIDLTALALITLQLTNGDSHAIKKGYEYIVRSQNSDGGYPQFFPCEVFISTYVGFLTTEVYSRADVSIPSWISQCKEWILRKQNPSGSWSFTGEYPFGDIDDTSWAMLWLIKGCNTHKSNSSIKAGEKFILSSQNPDGGFPAWPDLNSDTDLTAHALLILDILGESQKTKDTIFEFLDRTQEDNGSWIPRWHHSPMYGTTQVVLGMKSYVDTEVYSKALQFLIETQQDNGSWGTAEETGLVLSALLTLPEAPSYKDTIEKGISYLISSQNSDGSWDYKDLWIAECSYSSRPLAITPIVATLKAYSSLF